MTLPEWQNIRGLEFSAQRDLTDAGDEASSTFRSLIEKMPVSVTLVGADGVVKFANPETAKLTGCDRTRVEGHAFWLEAVHPEDAWKLMDAFRRGHGGSHHVVIFRFLSEARGPRLAEMHLFPSSADGRSLVEAVTFDVTERSEVEEALFQSEALYRIFLEQSPIGMLHLDAEGTVTFENHQFRQIIGEGADDAWIGRSIFSIEGLDDEITQPLRTMLESGDSLSGVMASYRGRTSVRQQLKLHGSPIHHPEGGIVGGVIMVEDRTEEVRRKDELDRRNRYASAESALRKAALSNNDESTFLNEAARVLGERTLADRVFILMSNAAGDCCTNRGTWCRDDREESNIVITQDEYPNVDQSESLHLLDHDDLQTSSLLTKTRANEAVWLPFWDEGRLGGFVVLEHLEVPADGSAAHWSESALPLIGQLVRLFETLWSWMLASNRYRHITGAIEDCLFNFAVDEDGERRYLFLTPQIELLTGYEASELLAREAPHASWSDDVVYEDDRHQVDAHTDALRDGRESKATYRVRHLDGTIRWLREHATAETDAMGDVVVSGILTDVTEQKEAERVLTEAKHHAESANQLKSAFIATMSHEIRTPMGALNGFAELLDRELEEHQEESGAKLPPQVDEFLQAIRENSQKMLTLVNDLFDISNLEEGSVELRRSTVSLNDVAMRCANKISSPLTQKSVKLHVDLDASEPVVLADPRRLEQVLDNLLSNAVKFTDEGSVTIKTGTPSQTRAVLEVSDTGVGISSEYRKRLFEPFSQEDNRLNRRFEGSGLGLALTKRLLDLMDGTIEVESQKRRGSKFVVTLPTSSPGRLAAQG